MRVALNAAERWAWRLGYSRIAGTDEAGRGALAGPLVAAAVILPHRSGADGLMEISDSKLLTPAARKKLFRVILEEAESWSFACISPQEVDEKGLQPANVSAMRDAVHSLSPPPDLVMVDYYTLGDLGIPQWSLVHGDRFCRSIAAASILAKVIRDHLMSFWSLHCPQYGFDRNMGYGTLKHLEALSEYGPSPCHRASFGGVLQTRMDLFYGE